MRIKAKERLAQLYHRLVDQDPLEITLTVSLLVLLLFPGDLWQHTIVVRVLAIWGFLDRGLTRQPWFWLTAAGLNFFMQNVYNWAEADNHHWLMTYWYLALACSLWHLEPRQAIQINARLLIGLAFLFATGRKLISPEYLSGTTFQELLYFDSRFGELARLTADLRLDRGETATAIASLQNALKLPSLPNIGWVASILTWWTLGIEALLALVFLLPSTKRICQWRNAALLTFIVSVFPIVPVMGFAWMLLVLGIAQCEANRKWTRLAYLILFATIRVFDRGFIKQALIDYFF